MARSLGAEPAFRENVDGIITMDASSRLPELATLIGNAPGCSARNMPMTAMSPAWASMMLAPRNAIDRLLARGCQRIALINHDLSYKYARSREDGYSADLRRTSVSMRLLSMPAT
jgi:DNA-binding LacI/PurR family transcriptional regulator